MGDIEAALDFLELLGPGEKINYTQIAQKYGVDRSTLSRRHRRVVAPPSEKYENHRLLNNAQEKELI